MTSSVSHHRGAMLACAVARLQIPGGALLELLAAGALSWDDLAGCVAYELMGARAALPDKVDEKPEAGKMFTDAEMEALG